MQGLQFAGELAVDATSKLAGAAVAGLGSMLSAIGLGALGEAVSETGSRGAMPTKPDFQVERPSAPETPKAPKIAAAPQQNENVGLPTMASIAVIAASIPEDVRNKALAAVSNMGSDMLRTLNETIAEHTPQNVVALNTASKGPSLDQGAGRFV